MVFPFLDFCPFFLYIYITMIFFYGLNLKKPSIPFALKARSATSAWSITAVCLMYRLPAWRWVCARQVTAGRIKGSYKERDRSVKTDRLLACFSLSPFRRSSSGTFQSILINPLIVHNSYWQHTLMMGFRKGSYQRDLPKTTPSSTEARKELWRKRARRIESNCLALESPAVHGNVIQCIDTHMRCYNSSPPQPPSHRITGPSQ